MVAPASVWPHATKPCLSNPPEGTVGIVIPLRDNLKFFKLAFHSILDFTDYRFMITIVDNMSSFSTRQYLESIRRNHAVNVLQYQQTHAQGAEWNMGLRFMFAFANVQYGVALTPDVVVEPNWLSRLVKALDHDHDFAFPQSNEGPDQTPGFCTAFRRAAYEGLGGFNEGFHEPGPTSSNLMDRARKANCRLFWDTETYVHHFKRGIRPDAELVSQDNVRLKAQVPA